LQMRNSDHKFQTQLTHN